VASAALVAIGLATLPGLAQSLRPRVLRRLPGAAPLFWESAPALPAMVALSDLVRGTHTLAHTKPMFALLPLLLLAIARAWVHTPLPALRRALPLLWLGLFTATSLSNIALHVRNALPYEALAKRLAVVPHDGEWIVVPTQEWGFVFPLLLSFRDAGVRGGALVVASEAQLPALLARARATPGLRGVVLVGLHVTWNERAGWSREALGALARAARARGWRVGAQGGAPDAPRLRIAPDVWAYYYSM